MDCDAAQSDVDENLSKQALGATEYVLQFGPKYYDSSRECDNLRSRSSHSHLPSASPYKKNGDVPIPISDRFESSPLSPDRMESRKAFQFLKESKIKPRSSSIDDPITPGDSKMAHKIAAASSKADKTFCELMVSKEFDDIITSGALSNSLQSYENYSRQSTLIGGAFNTISNFSDEPHVGQSKNIHTETVVPDEVVIPSPSITTSICDHFESIDDSNRVDIDFKHITVPQSQSHQTHITPQYVRRKVATTIPTIPRNNVRENELCNSSEIHPVLYQSPPQSVPCPFEIAMWNTPYILSEILGLLGDPVIICRFKAVNKFCNRFIFENEYLLMKEAVRTGGIPPHMRPAFWMYITLSRCVLLQDSEMESETSSGVQSITNLPRFHALEQDGRASKWHHVITRDVSRAFGNMPPHKRSTRSRSSIVRALVSWGRDNLISKQLDLRNIEKTTDKPIRRIVVASPMLGMRRKIIEMQHNDEDEIEKTNTVSDWSGISPLDSNVSCNSVESVTQTDSFGDIVLSGNGLSCEMKSELQKKLETILNAIAAAHKGVGYCQGMDYVVAHLLRVLQETIEWSASRNRLPSCIKSYVEWTSDRKIPVRYTMIVEECVFLVMHTFLCTYNLRHMYWPELRCLKTCCRIFSKIIQKKLPVLADHFDHHELNVGLFSLGWFQTLFLYIPSMPSKTINHMWDIWLVERSMKIFYRIGCAILFLSQPILLNNELEGMMTYLNTFPDATIFSSDILINCALQIKITTKMLSNIEFEVIHENDVANKKTNT